MKYKNVLSVILIFSLVTLLGEASSFFGWIPEWLVPAPSKVFRLMFEMRQDLLSTFSETFFVSIKGLLISFIFGTILAFLLSLSESLESAISPIAIFFQTVPVVAIAPLLVIWFGFGEAAVLACCVIVSFFPILANTLVGIKSTPKEMLELGSLYRLNKLQMLIRIRIPSAALQIVSGLKIACGLAIIGAIIGEFVAGGGIGGLIDSARTQQRVDIVFAALLICSLYGVLLLASINAIERWLLRWRPFYSLS